VSGSPPRPRTAPRAATETARTAEPGRLYVGTSGFAYPRWAPLFYPQGTRGDELLRRYAERLSACELNNTFYQQPTEAKIAAWLAATPPEFRFTVKAQRGGSIRALVADPAGSIAWLTPPYRQFGERLGSVLFRVPGDIARDDDRLATLLAAWPRDLPLTVECQDPSWHVDEVLDLLRSAGAAWCTTELDEQAEPPPIHVTGPHLYLRLRRTTYEQDGVLAWAARLAPFLAAGHDAFVFFRHDETGVSALRAVELGALVARQLGADLAAR
jgi:uncharacterized protein YecE (DUF72 family)